MSLSPKKDTTTLEPLTLCSYPVSSQSTVFLGSQWLRGFNCHYFKLLLIINVDMHTHTYIHISLGFVALEDLTQTFL